MMSERIYRSEASEAIHETVSGFREAGLISESEMRAFDEMCLKPVEELASKEDSGDDRDFDEKRLATLQELSELSEELGLDD